MRVCWRATLSGERERVYIGEQSSPERESNPKRRSMVINVPRPMEVGFTFGYVEIWLVVLSAIVMLLMAHALCVGLIAHR